MIRMIKLVERIIIPLKKRGNDNVLCWIEYYFLSFLFWDINTFYMWYRKDLSDHSLKGGLCCILLLHFQSYYTAFPYPFFFFFVKEKWQSFITFKEMLSFSLLLNFYNISTFLLLNIYLTTLWLLVIHYTLLLIAKTLSFKKRKIIISPIVP